MTLIGYFMLISVFSQQGCRALTLALAKFSCSSLTASVSADSLIVAVFLTGFRQQHARVLPNRIEKRELNDICSRIDAYSALLVHPKIIFSRGSTPNPAKGAYSAPPDPLASVEEALNFRHSNVLISASQDKFLAMPMGSLCN